MVKNDNRIDKPAKRNYLNEPAVIKKNDKKPKKMKQMRLDKNHQMDRLNCDAHLQSVRIKSPFMTRVQNRRMDNSIN